MKHKIVAAALVVVAVLLVAGAVGAWHTQRGRALALEVKAVAQHQAQVQLDKQRAAQVQKRYDQLNAECHAGQASYDAQSLVYRKAHVRPVCDLPLAQ